MTDNQSLPTLIESDVARYRTEQSFEQGENYNYRPIYAHDMSLETEILQGLEELLVMIE